MGRSVRGRESGLVTLTFRNLERRDRVLMIWVLEIVLLWSIVLLLIAWYRGNGVTRAVPNGYAIAAGFLSYGAIAAAVYWGAQRDGWRFGKTARLICAFLPAVAAMIVVDDYNGSFVGNLLGRLAGGIVVGISLAMAIATVRSRQVGPKVCAGAGLAQGMLLLVAAATRPNLLDFTPQFNSMAEIDADPILTGIIVPLTLAAPAYVLLGAAAWALFTVRVGLAVTRPYSAPVGTVASILAVKLLWVALAIADVLPAWLRGREATWDAVRGDGWASWLLSTVLVIGLLGWLVTLDRKAEQINRTVTWAEKERPENGEPPDNSEQKTDAGSHAVFRGWPAWLFRWPGAPEPAMSAGLDFGDRVVRLVVWVVAAPSFGIALIAILYPALIGGNYLYLLLVGALIVVLVKVVRSRIRHRGLVGGCLGLGLAGLLLVPFETRWDGPWWLGTAIDLQMNYVFFAASLGLVALGVSAMLAYRLLRAGQQRAVVQGNTVLSASAAVVWLSVLLPISACFLVPLLSSFPLAYPPTGSFHIANLLPDRETMAYLSLEMGDPAPETPQPGWGGPGGTFEWVTFDTVLTLGLAVYLVFSATGRLRRSPYGHLLVMAICVTSTFVAHSATLSPVTWGRGAWLYCAMVFPALYTLLFDSKEDCRKPGSFFGLAVVNAVAITTLGVLSVSADSFLEDTNALDSTVFGYAREFGASFYVYPMAITFVVLALTRWRLTRPNNVPRAEST